MNGHDEPGFASICTKADWERWQRDSEGFWRYVINEKGGDENDAPRDRMESDIHGGTKKPENVGR